ncbi:MAG: Uncharacterised protein [Hyphomonas sp. TMED17]|nr:MAG: Uncharacterised protein [Hyphomonas sp. TMED17]
MPKNADNSTFFAGFVVVEIKDHSTILKELLQQRTMGPLVKGQEATDRDTVDLPILWSQGDNLRQFQ